MLGGRFIAINQYNRKLHDKQQEANPKKYVRRK
jgi:hypothetical protein